MFAGAGTRLFFEAQRREGAKNSNRVLKSLHIRALPLRVFALQLFW
jgi:hypothetical protein